MAKRVIDIIKGAGIKLNSIQNIYITESGTIPRKGKKQNMIEAKKFVSLMNFKMPNPLLRSLTPEFMLYYWNGNQPFFL